MTWCTHNMKDPGLKGVLLLHCSTVNVGVMLGLEWTKTSKNQNWILRRINHLAHTCNHDQLIPLAYKEDQLQQVHWSAPHCAIKWRPNSYFRISFCEPCFDLCTTQKNPTKIIFQGLSNGVTTAWIGSNSVLRDYVTFQLQSFFKTDFWDCKSSGIVVLHMCVKRVVKKLFILAQTSRTGLLGKLGCVNRGVHPTPYPPPCQNRLFEHLLSHSLCWVCQIHTPAGFK